MRPYRYWTIFGAVILIAALSSLTSGDSRYGVLGLLGVGFIVTGEVERVRGRPLLSYYAKAITT